MSLFSEVKYSLTKNAAYGFKAHAAGPFKVAATAPQVYEPGFGGIRIRSGWRRGLNFRRYQVSGESSVL